MKTALVTGGSAGIGSAIALGLAGEGFSVIISGRRPGGEVAGLLESLNERAGRSGARYVRGDLADEATRDELVRVIKEEYGMLSVLVNNAGVTTRGRKDMLELTEDDMLWLLRINLIAPFLLSSALAQLLGGGDEPGYIVNISSISAYTASVNRADYCISKAGLSMMTLLFAERLAAMNVRVFEVRPGIIRTDMTEGVAGKYDRMIEGGLLPIKRWGEPDDVARAVLGVVLGYHPYSTGTVINVDGGFHIRRL
ncbi:MAG: 3-ketoacyl-ACP reductase [Deltaproteobacteria bacterium]|nr:3-ketoacyl-ACP reductase [Candidatus Zymogenaceae bacterium]